MPYVLVKHKVEDFASWKPVFDDHSEMRRVLGGSKGGILFRSTEDTSEVFVLVEVDDLDRARKFIASGDLREAMEKSGVIGKPEIHFLDKIEEFADAAIAEKLAA